MAVKQTVKTKTATNHDRIDLHQPYEIGYWARRFGVSELKLAEAIERVGTNAEDVAIELGKSYAAPDVSSCASYRGHRGT